MSTDDEVEYFPGGLLDCEDVAYWPEGVGLKGNDDEQALHDDVAEESTRFEGDPIEFWSQDLDRSVVNPVTRQVSKRYWSGPFKLFARIEWPDSTPETKEEGFLTTWSSRVWVARVSLEKIGAPAPVEGDIVRFWDIPFFNDKVRLGQLFPAGLYFNVTDSDTDGHVGSTSTFMGFWLTLKRRTDYAPERRIFDER